jgi:LPXTG-motif cell wall-anchored protein
MLDQAMQLQLPHWLIIAGIVLTTIGTLGMLFRRRKDASSEQSAKER